MLCQTHPELKKKKENIARFNHHLNSLTLADYIDILVFPEMAFTGYNFKNSADVIEMAVFFGQGEEF